MINPKPAPENNYNSVAQGSEFYDSVCIDCSGDGGHVYQDSHGWYGETCDLCGGSGYMPADLENLLDTETEIG